MDTANAQRWNVPLLKLLSISILLACCVSAADFKACPAKIDVKPQQLATPVPGSTVAYTNSQNHALWLVEIYDGDPKEKADLIPDINEPLKQAWTLTPHERPYWLECHYTQTSIVLRYRLPDSVKSCVVTMHPGVKLDGQSVIKGIECR